MKPLTLKIAFLLENYSAPWNEGYKNLARYIIEMLGDSVTSTVIVNGKNNLPFSNFDLVYIFNPKINSRLFFNLAMSKTPKLKQIAKKELDISLKENAKAVVNSKFLWNAVVVTTPQLKQELIHIMDDRKIFYLPPPIPVNFFVTKSKEESRASLGLSTKFTYIAYLGRLNTFRKMSIFFEALNEARLTNVRLLLSISEADLLQKELLSRGLRNLVNPNIVNMVNSEDIRLLYSCADLIVYPVERRGAIEPPLTLLEAMSCGAAVAAYDNPITHDLIKDNNGFLFSQSSELGAIIESIDKGSLDIQEMGKRARTTILKDYNSANLADKYLQCFKIISEQRH